MSADSANTPSNYLRYLPGVYAKADDGFLGHYLKIFEKLLTGLADGQLDGRKGIQELMAAGVIGNLFYSRFSFLFPGNTSQFIPPISGATASEETRLLAEFNSYIGVPAPDDPLAGHVAARVADTDGGSDWQANFTAWLNEFLAWLAGWVDLVLDTGWSIDKKRTVIAEIMALYRLRGTAQGLHFLLNLLFDLPQQVGCYTVDANQQTTQTTGPLKVKVLNPTPKPIIAGDGRNPATAFILQDQATPTLPVVSGYVPWLFYVQVLLPNATNPALILNTAGAQAVQTLLNQLRTTLDQVKPAGSQYQIQILPGAQLLTGVAAPQLNHNAVLGTQVS